jgi:alpha-tubulin suppressor-like RCC1 family protein
MTAIAAGVRHSCALTTAGGVKCWGYNRGALGDGTADRRHTPVDVVGLTSGVSAVAAGNDSSCALTSSGGVKCWGLNDRGELGDGTTTSRLTPVDVVGLQSGVKAVASGTGLGRACALTTAGGVRCWGRGNPTPVQVPGLGSGVTAVTSSCALTSVGAVKCWGRDDLTPVDVPGLGSGVAAITSSFHSCALLSSGAVKCWGPNDHGQLGDGTTTDRPTPVDVGGLHARATAIAAGSFHTCALMSGGSVECWGANDVGQLGDGTTVDRPRPVAVIGLGTATATAAIVSRSVAVTRARVAAIVLRCGTEARCRGTLSLTSQRVKLGSSPFSIAARAARAVRVKLTPRGFALLVHAKRLSANAGVTGTATTARTVSLIAP